MNTGLYVATGRLLILSKLKDKKKTMMALKKAWKAFENILPEFLVLILLVGVLLAVLNPEVISRIIAAILSRLVSKEEVRSIYEAAEKIAN